MLIDTKEKMEKRRKHFEDEEIDSLLEKHHKAVREGNWFKASKIAWILARFHSIEGDHDYSVGSSQE